MPTVEQQIAEIIFGHAQSGLISPSEWRLLNRYRPGRGWRLSSVTALELLVGLDNLTTENKFQNFRKRVELAGVRGAASADLQGCFEDSFPSRIPRLPVESLGQHMQVIRRARSLKRLREGRIHWKLGYARLESTDAVRKVVAPVKQRWIEQVHLFADATFPDWRTCYAKTGRRLQPEVWKGIDRKAVFEARSVEFAKGRLEVLDAKSDSRPELASDMRRRLDAVLRFTVFVVDQFMERNYSLEKHDSDVFDQFQLHHLALDQFVIVSNDPDMWKRTGGSPLASRIMLFEDFLRSLS